MLYYKAFKQMGLAQAKLVESVTPLIGFSTDAVWPIRKVTLNMQACSIVLPTDFLVVDIIGRTWLHRMRAISSTYHQMIKFLGVDGIKCIKENQKVIQQCLVQIVKKSPKVHLV